MTNRPILKLKLRPPVADNLTPLRAAQGDYQAAKRRARKMRSAVKKIVRERFPRGATVYWEDQSGVILQHRGHSDPLPKVRHAVTQAATWVPASDINHVAIEATSPATDPVASLAVS